MRFAENSNNQKRAFSLYSEQDRELCREKLLCMFTACCKSWQRKLEGYKYLQIENSNSESDMYIFYNDECIIMNDEVFVSFEKKI